ncbi:cytochrome P450 [Xanthomonas campestris pv. raphani]|uniref:cytochrome P450 n=1 Tax=Xanthomonas campestris TaxID=339 RepID=UPI002B22A3AC|nr:cytochrome P450 [Xanthomonas campestris]MEA9760396.1 cytochrome P450 [Xanthomonas campestris pv. raphani]
MTMHSSTTDHVGHAAQHLRDDVADATAETQGRIAQAPQRDVLPALLRDGYAFVSRHCEALGSDAFQARLALQQVVFARGPDALATFYHPGRFTRVGAMPPTTLRLLQGRGSVQQLDGDAHLQRKRLFLSVLTPAETSRLVACFEEEWSRQADTWARSAHIILQQEAEHVLCRAACRWAGMPLRAQQSRPLARDLGAMIDGAGAFGPRWVRGWRGRRRVERWVARAVRNVRRAGTAPEASIAATVAWHRDADGVLLSVPTAVTELINLLRPIVAVARWISFCALALHEHPPLRSRLRAGEPGLLQNTVQEVRRFYPFFPLIGGRVRMPFVWRDRHFKQGDWMMVDLYGTNHHPAVWRDPERFDPSRFEHWKGSRYDFVAQGGGSVERDHRCPGENPSIALLMSALSLLASSDYTLPPQDLRYPLNRFPTLPRSGVVLRDFIPPVSVGGVVQSA